MSTVRTTVRLVIYGGLLLSLSQTTLQSCFAVGMGRQETIAKYRVQVASSAIDKLCLSLVALGVRLNN